MSTTWQGFIVLPTGRVWEVEDDGETAREWDSGSLYDDLVLAGYPLTNDRIGGHDCYIDLAITGPNEVTVYTVGAPPREHKMPNAGLFIAWHSTHAEEDA